MTHHSHAGVDGGHEQQQNHRIAHGEHGSEERLDERFEALGFLEEADGAQHADRSAPQMKPRTTQSRHDVKVRGETMQQHAGRLAICSWKR